MAGVSVHGLTKRFGDRVVLDELDLDIAPGEFVALLGHSGSGKSTLLRVLAGIDQDIDGTAQVDGTVSMAFQQPRLLPWRRVWRNIVTPAKSKVAESLDEYRGQFAYNLLDTNVRQLMAQTAAIVQWDDHEVLNNWYPGEILDLPQYTEKRVDVLARRAFQAFHEWQPVDQARAVDGRVYRSFSFGRRVDVFVLDMRTYKDANTAPKDGVGHILG
ncbi:alkaline phosphatase D family protein, partial [Kibdelosporangium lantanae]